MAQEAIACPRCAGEMETRVRSGVVIDVCPSCHGIFLDRGEFERLMGMEATSLGSLIPAAGSRTDTD